MKCKLCKSKIKPVKADKPRHCDCLVCSQCDSTYEKQKKQKYDLKVMLALSVPKDSMLMDTARIDSPNKRVEKVVRDEIVSWLSDLGVEITNIEVEKTTK